MCQPLTSSSRSFTAVSFPSSFTSSAKPDGCPPFRVYPERGTREPFCDFHGPFTMRSLFFCLWILAVTVILYNIEELISPPMNVISIFHQRMIHQTFSDRCYFMRFCLAIQFLLVQWDFTFPCISIPYWFVNIVPYFELYPEIAILIV